MTFDNVQARIVPRSNFVALGETFEAEIFLVAFDSRTRVTANVNGQNLVSRDGVVEYRSPTSREGLHSVSGWIDLGGDRFPFKTEYVVAAPAGSVSADAMNVFYIGVDNPITTAVSGVEPGNVNVSVSGAGATIHPVAGSNNRHIVRVTSTGQATVTLKAGARTVGSFNYRVKRVPDPLVLVNGIDQHTTTVERGTIASGGGLVTRMPDFDFQMNIPIVSFTMATTVSGEFTELRATGPRFTEQMIAQINNARRGQRISFENIVVQMPTGNQNVRNFSLTIR
jgi:gliding motility-associated protein GldM